MARLLIIEDDAAVAEVIRLVLTRHGHEVTVAASGAQGLGLLATGLSPDGVILDVWLRGEDGLDVAERLIALPAPPPFAIMSGGGPGRTLERVTARADALGARGVLYKPFDDDELLSLVARLTQRSG